MMQSVLVTAAALSLFACSGGSTLGTDGGASDGGKSSGFADDDASTSAEGGSGFGCTPGSYVFCRCSDRSEGTKLCRADGQGFDPCATHLGACP